MLQIAQSSMNDPRGPAGRPGSKIMLLDKKRPFTAAGTLARNGNAVNSAANHDYLKPLPFQRRPSFRIDFHTPTEPLRTENWQLRTGSLLALLALIYSVYTHVGHRRALRTRSVDHGQAARSRRLSLGPRADVRLYQTLHARRNLRSPRSHRQSRLARTHRRTRRPPAPGSLLLGDSQGARNF